VSAIPGVLLTTFRPRGIVGGGSSSGSEYRLHLMIERLAPPLSTALQVSPDVTITTRGSVSYVSGVLDYESAEEFAAALQRAGGPGRSSLVLDLHEVTFMDVAGVRTLLGFAGSGHSITIANPSSPVELLLRVPAIRSLFEVVRFAARPPSTDGHRPRAHRDGSTADGA
jgi:anti-anti-sigma factor